MAIQSFEGNLSLFQPLLYLRRLVVDVSQWISTSSIDLFRHRHHPLPHTLPSSSSPSPPPPAPPAPHHALLLTAQSVIININVSCNMRLAKSETHLVRRRVLLTSVLAPNTPPTPPTPPRPVCLMHLLVLYFTSSHPQVRLAMLPTSPASDNSVSPSPQHLRVS